MLCAGLLLAPATRAYAQGDGARAYQFGSADARSLSAYGLFVHGNQVLDPSRVTKGADIRGDVVVIQPTVATALADRLGQVFAVVQLGKVSGSLPLPTGSVTSSSSGLGDSQLGWEQNVIGPPAATGSAFLALQPGLLVNLLGKITMPTGAYSSSQYLNLGSNRWAFQLGAPICYYIGHSFVDARLTTFELVPTINLYTSSPGRKGTQKEAPLFGFEEHITRNLSEALWVSLDGLLVRGGQTTTNGVSDGNAQLSVGLGGTVGFSVGEILSFTLSYGGDVSRNDNGVDGHGVRITGARSF